MTHEELIAAAKSYISYETDSKFRTEVYQSLEKEDWKDLEDRFAFPLSFGTAGLRGIIGGGINRMNTYVVRRASQGLAEYLGEYFTNPSCVIAYDSRNYSEEFARSAAVVLASNGVRTYLYDTLHPVPMLSFAVRNLKTSAGIVITASHNPAVYNGYKVYWSDGGQITPPHDKNIAEKIKNVKLIIERDEWDLREAKVLTSVPPSVDEAYYGMALNSLRRPIGAATAAYTPLHGSGNIPVRFLLSKVGVDCAVVKEQELPDGNFPTVKYPNPESREAMEKVISLAQSINADIAFGTDPDADRLGVAVPDSSGVFHLLDGNQIASLLADYLLMTYSENPKAEKPVVVKSFVTTDLVRRIAEFYSAECRDVLTGFKYIAEQIEQLEGDSSRKFIFGCEESYGYLTVPHVHDKDAVSTSVAVLEMTGYYRSKGKTLFERLNEIYEKFGYYNQITVSKDFPGIAGKEEIAKRMLQARSAKPGDVLFGLKIAGVQDLKNDPSGEFPAADVLIIRFETGEKLVVRPSGTEPKIKYYLFLTKRNDELLDRVRKEL